MSAINAASERQLRIAIVEESTRGTTPASPAYDVVPHLTGAFFQSTRNYERSSVLIASRMGGQQIGGTRQSQGVIRMPLVKETAFELLLQSSLAGALGSFIDTAAITGTFEADDDSFTRATGNFLTDVIADRLRIGDKVAISGASTNATTLAEALDASETEIDLTSASNFPTPATGATEAILIENEWITYTGKSTNTLTGCTRGAFGSTADTHADTTAAYPVKTITAITATKLTFANHPCVDETSVAITFKTRKKQILAGTTRKFFTVEEWFEDIDEYERFMGQEVNTTTAQIPTSGETSFEANLIGTDNAATQAASSTYTAAAGNKPMSGSVTGTRVLIDAAVPDTCFESVQITTNNNLAAKFGVGTETACLVEIGDFDAEIQYAAYFVDLTETNRFINGDRFELIVEIRDQEDDHGIRYIFPELVYTAGPKSVSGQTVVEQFTGFAEYSADAGTKLVVEIITGS